MISLKRVIMIMFAAGSIALPAASQSTASTETAGNPAQRIEESSNGMVTIDIPQSLLYQIMRDDYDRKNNEDRIQIRPGINKLQGYRIQVFGDGSNQRTLEARARARSNAIIAKFPKYRGQVYSFSSAPNWYTRVGNFRTQEDAAAALAELKRAFPGFSNEMRVVRSQIIVIGR